MTGKTEARLALLITPYTLSHIPYPADRPTASLAAWLSGHVGGYLEAVQLGTDHVMWINEDGKLANLPMNPLASDLAARHQAVSAADWIAGTAIVTGATGPDTRGLTFSEVIALWA